MGQFNKLYTLLSASPDNSPLIHAVDEAKEAAVATRVYKEFEPTTTKQLNVICWQTKPWKDKKPSRLFSSQFAVAWKVDCDEVYPGIRGSLHSWLAF